MILLDTDACIELLRGNENVLFHRSAVSDEIAVAFMTVGELFLGAFESDQIEANTILVEKFLLSVSVLDTNFEIMKKYAELRSRLDKAGTRRPDADLLIGATALVECEKLVTGNAAHYERIPNLKLENWMR